MADSSNHFTPWFRDFDRRLTDRVLSHEGYPPARKWCNSMVETVFGCCSKQHHMLQVLVQNHRCGVAWLNEWTNGKPDWQGCVAYENSAGPSYRKRLGGKCPECKSYIEFTIMSSRLIAIFKLPVAKAWKGVLTRKQYPMKYLFEGSGRCNIFGHPNHCMTASHLVLETFLHNSKRKRHHAGYQRCDCVRRCIGVDVDRSHTPLSA